MKNISVVIPTYNSWITLKECIKSIYNQTISVKEIIVVNNNSADDTYNNVRKFFPKVKLINLKINTGVTGGRNAGLKAASSEYIFFFDHDMIADKNMLKNLLLVAESDEKIGVVTPKIYYWSDKKRIWSAGTNINLWNGQVLFRGGIDVGQYASIEQVAVAPAAMLVKKVVLDKIKGFDDRYFAVYEDTDFCFRALKAGFKVFYTPYAIAYHDIEIDPHGEAKRLLDRSYWIGRNRVLFMRDYANNFLIFSLFIPIYIVYYGILAIKNNRFKPLIEFVRGTINGLILK